MSARDAAPLILVSDNVAFRDGLMRRFQGVLWNPLCFSSWEDAQHAIETERPPVVVADRDWGQLLTLTSLMEPSPLVVAVCPTLESYARALKAGVYDAVVEPFEEMEPVWTIACALHFATGRAAGREEAPCGFA